MFITSDSTYPVAQSHSLDINQNLSALAVPSSQNSTPELGILNGITQGVQSKFIGTVYDNSKIMASYEARKVVQKSGLDTKISQKRETTPSVGSLGVRKTTRY